MQSEIVYLGGGCFWCIEAVFVRIKGVTSTQLGYMGGQSENPSYEQVCTGLSGHVEVVKVEFNPKQIELKQILKIFFSVHDPTSLDRQGDDVGSQYRSAIFYTAGGQQKTAKKLIEQIQPDYNKKIVTRLIMAKRFWLAEDYHHGYFDRNRYQPYCQLVISPKLAKLNVG